MMMMMMMMMMGPPHHSVGTVDRSNWIYIHICARFTPVYSIAKPYIDNRLKSELVHSIEQQYPIDIVTAMIFIRVSLQG